MRLRFFTVLFVSVFNFFQFYFAYFHLCISRYFSVLFHCSFTVLSFMRFSFILVYLCPVLSVFFFLRFLYKYSPPFISFPFIYRSFAVFVFGGVSYGFMLLSVPLSPAPRVPAYPPLRSCLKTQISEIKKMTAF